MKKLDEQTNQNDMAINQEHWKLNTRKLKTGVLFSTVLLVLYNVLLFIPFHQDGNNTMDTMDLIMLVVFFILLLGLAFLCMQYYSRGIARFSNLFENGGKRSLFLVRWGFWLTIAGVVLQMLVFFMIHPSAETLPFLWLLIGNILLIAATVVSVAGFLSLSASKGMPHNSRRAALHQSWSCAILLIGACMLSYAILQHGLAIKFATIIVNLVGTYFYFIHWRRLLNPNNEKEDKTDPIENE